MKSYEFYATTDLGGDGATYFTVELTDEEAALLEEYGRKESVYYDGFSECAELKEIYSKVYSIAVAELTEELRDYEEFEDDDEQEVNLKDEGLANEEAQLEAEFEDEDFDETGMGEDDDID